MDIQSVSQLAKAAAEQASKPDAVETDAGLVDKFSQLMQLGTPAISQAANLVTQVGTSDPLMKAANMMHQTGTSQPLTGATDMGAAQGINPSPEAMLASQMLMGKAIVEVDLAAKTAGALSQSINKLVNMQ
ncbi:EscI/YscI/HrpB family type III secretion system inner rod protein [Shewanella psychropiezotolerans]|uniref:EscI/YscI/HrpB family type III secretion system inner rod protein n=1 Tax=Shewanella psychropiezotolerans TaxID=2593655 RepID=A0ABX5X2R8_9GAMM|nr:type III secretion system inner rod subunit SctI [Shewanella psychropiezotolerans]QDO84238.1 EscI/YscI/HrpB family type III secretion system inner rod protein [Shewanella psychropiezotolerans]